MERGAGAVAILFMVLQFVLAFAQLFAFQAAFDVLWGWGSFAALLLFLALMFLGGGPGSVIIAGFAFYGAFRGWDWEWWQALLLAAPYLVVVFAMMAFTGSSSLLKAATSRKAIP